MNYKKIFLRISYWFAGFMVLWFLLICIYVYKTVPRQDPNKEVLQMCRIDFKEPIDSAEAKKIRSYVGNLEDVRGTYFNVNQGVLSYAFKIGGNQSAENVFNELMKFHAYKAVRFVVTKEQYTKGCPVMDKSSFNYKLASYLQKFI